MEEEAYLARGELALVDKDAGGQRADVAVVLPDILLPQFMLYQLAQHIELQHTPSMSR